MKIKTTQTFLDGRDRYENDTEYDVPTHKGYYFCQLGWAKSLDNDIETEEQPGEVNLNIHDSVVGTESENLNG